MQRGLSLTHLQLASNPPDSGIPSRAEVTKVKLLCKYEERLPIVDSCTEKTLPKLPCRLQNPQMSLGIASGRPEATNQPPRPAAPTPGTAHPHRYLGAHPSDSCVDDSFRDGVPGV